MKVLNQAYIMHNILIDKLDHLLKNIVADNFIYFSDDKIPSNDRGNTKTLHIKTKIKDYTLPKVLIDNGSSLNVIPMTTLSTLLVDVLYMKQSHTIVRAFNGTKREVMREIELATKIGPHYIQCRVLGNRHHNCLLGRSWIHMDGTVPFTLH